jgi:hypothetical protein
MPTTELLKNCYFIHLHKMKKLIFFACLVLVAITASAQQGYQTFTNDTTKGAETIYFTSSVKVAYAGQIGFEGICDGFAASDDVVIILQGTNDAFATKSFDIDTIPTYSSTTATPFILKDVPANYLFYRLKCVGASTDTVLIKNVIFNYKR